MGKIAYENNIDEIVRVMCDNIVYKSNVEFNVEHMVREEKTSGLIKWNNGRKI